MSNFPTVSGGLGFISEIVQFDTMLLMIGGGCDVSRENDCVTRRRNLVKTRLVTIKLRRIERLYIKNVFGAVVVVVVGVKI